MINTAIICITIIAIATIACVTINTCHNRKYKENKANNIIESVNKLWTFLVLNKETHPVSIDEIIHELGKIKEL